MGTKQLHATTHNILKSALIPFNSSIQDVMWQKVDIALAVHPAVAIPDNPAIQPIKIEEQS